MDKVYLKIEALRKGRTMEQLSREEHQQVLLLDLELDTARHKDMEDAHNELS